MQCPLCKLEGRIDATRYVVEDDDSKEKETKLFFEQDIKCVNKDCPNHNKIFTTIKSPMEIG